MKNAYLILLLILLSTAATAQTTVRDFESGVADWRATRDSVKLEKAPGAPDDGGSSSLRIHGSGSGFVNYAVDSKTVAMESRQFFRISARVKIDRLGEDTPLPYVKCIFKTDWADNYLGQGLTEAYDTSRMGEWQTLEGEFRVPYGTVRGGHAVGGKSRLDAAVDAMKDVDITIDTVTLERIPHYTIDDKYFLDPVPEPLENARGVHPRIYLTDARIEELRQAITTTHRDLFREFIGQTDGILRNDPPKYMDESEWSNIEQLYMRGVGNNMPFLALAYVLTGDRKYLDGAKTWALAACSYPTWGLHEFANVDLATGHQLYGLALVYDWLYNDLDEATRRTIRDTIVTKCSHLFDVAAKGIIVADDEAYRRHPWPEWDEAYLQNHMWINSGGLATAGLAVFDEVPEATRWMAFTLDRYRRTMDLLGSDGASHEGPGYWTYGVDWMLKFMVPARDLLGVDMFDNDWWRNTWKYRLYMGLPENSWTYSNSTVDVGDSRRYDWYGPDYMLRFLASEYRNGYAQWLAGALDDAGAEHPVDRWLNILWYDPSVEPIPPDDLPTLYRFDDMDIASARSDWSGDESFLFFKCGPYIGHKAIREFMYCPSSAHHVHPDTGNFMLFGEGEWLIRDDGYRAKWTGYHNTLIIHGFEQLGGGDEIFVGHVAHGAQARPRIVRAVSTPELDHLAGDATEAYPRNCGLNRFVRHLIYLKPDVLIVVDDIALENTRGLELRFHPEQQEAEQFGTIFTTRGEKAALRFEPLTQSGLTINAEKIDTHPKGDGEIIPLYTIRLRTIDRRWRNAVALSWAKTNADPVDVSLTDRGNTWIFSAGDREVTFDWTTGEASLKR